MAMSKGQRLGVLITGIVLMIGTIGSFLVICLSISNETNDQAQSTASLKQYQEQQKAAAQVNASNSEALPGYSAGTFAASSVTKLNVEKLVEGTGKTIKATDSINASYSGWLPDGTIFDSTKKKGANDAPADFSLSSVITGWQNGLTGVKVGSTVRLTIPSDQAYGTSGSGIIPASTPLQFIVTVHSIKQ
jgi:FKBP-type peptidyl-prolyl cis-trans isomerase